MAKIDGEDDDTAVLDTANDDPTTLQQDRGDAADAAADEVTESTVAEAEADDDLVITIGGEEAPAEEDNRAPDWVRELRRSNKDKDRKLREQAAELERLRGGQQPAALGEKPTLAEFADAEQIAKYETDLAAWMDRKRSADERQRQAQEADQRNRQQWQTRLDAISKAADDLKVKDFDDASLSFEETFSVVQQGIIAAGPEEAKTSALLRYALGKNPKKAKELAAIADPVKFAFAVAKLETQLKVTPRKDIPAPERVIGGRTSGAAVATGTLEKLKEEARRTGDYTKYLQAKAAKTAKT